jgi:hypothetical protein
MLRSRDRVGVVLSLGHKACEALTQRIRDPGQDGNGGIGLAILELVQVPLGDIGDHGKLLARNPDPLATGADPGSDGAGNVVAWHGSSYFNGKGVLAKDMQYNASNRTSIEGSPIHF